MEKKHLAVGALVVVALAGYFGYPHYQELRFRLESGSTVREIGRFPNAAQILGLRQALRDDAQALGIDPQQLQVHLKVEPRAQGPVTFWYVRADVNWGGHHVAQERRIETKLSPEFFDELEEGGVEVANRDEDEG